MSKSLINLSRELLEKFGEPHLISANARITPPADYNTEKEALKTLNLVKTWDVHDTVRAAEFLMDSNRFIAFTAAFDYEAVDDLFNESDGTILKYEILGSIYLFLCSKLGLRLIKENKYEIENEILGPAEKEPGVDLDLIKQYLEPLTVFQIEPNSLFDPSAPPEYTAYYISTYLNKYNESYLSNRSIFLVRSLFFSYKKNLIEKNIFTAISCANSKHAFLEAYRSLEFVFVFPRANALLQRLDGLGHKLSLSIMDFARHCYDELGWKRIERDAIERLLIEHAKNNPQVFQNLCDNCLPLFKNKSIVPASDEGFQNSIKAIAKIYYETRNQVVHQFWPDEEKLISDREWEALIEFTLECIYYFYSIDDLNK